jgi:hypothetical protein
MGLYQALVMKEFHVKHEANLAIWASVGAIIGAAIGLTATLSGHPLPQTPMESGAGGFMVGMFCAMAKNKLAH